MQARDQLRLDTLRSALSGFIYKRTESGRELSDAEELEVVRRLVKQRGDSLAEFEKAGRADLADKERAEREILNAYLPPQRSAAEIREIVAERAGRAARRLAQRGRRDEGRHAPAQRPGRRQSGPPNRHRRTRQLARYGASVTFGPPKVATGMKGFRLPALISSGLLFCGLAGFVARAQVGSPVVVVPITGTVDDGMAHLVAALRGRRQSKSREGDRPRRQQSGRPRLGRVRHSRRALRRARARLSPTSASGRIRRRR